MTPNRSNHAMERTAARRASTVCVARISSRRPSRALVRRRSLYSRKILRLHTIAAIHVALGLCVLAARTSADSDAVEGRPAPEIEKIAFTVGVWETTAKYRFTPEATVFESKSVETVQWSPNRQFLISDQRSLMPAGPMNQLV